MPKRNPTPVITHTELLTRTFNDLHREAREWADRADSDPAKLAGLAATRPAWRCERRKENKP